MGDGDGPCPSVPDLPRSANYRHAPRPTTTPATSTPRRSPLAVISAFPEEASAPKGIGAATSKTATATKPTPGTGRPPVSPLLTDSHPSRLGALADQHDPASPALGKQNLQPLPARSHTPASAS